MRLIDADALKPMMKYATTDSEIGVFPIRIGFNAITEVINNSPTIDAIPIEWILNNERMPKEGKGHDAIMDMIADWREKNDKIN